MPTGHLRNGVCYDCDPDVQKITKKIKTALDSQVAGDHYKNMKIQPIEFVQANELNYCEAGVIKYVCRHRNKNGAEDIKKAIHLLELLLELEYKE